MAKGTTLARISPAKGVKPGVKIDLPKVCIVTGEFVGLFRNGGLGTSMTGTAELLAACGADVTVLYTGDVGEDIDDYVVKYANAGIRLQVLKKLDKREFLGRLESVYHMSNSWRVYDHLIKDTFDVIHFNDTMGEGVCSVVAKKAGLSFQNTLINLAVHSPTEWILHANRHLADWLGFACFTGSEKICIEMADVVWGPSEYLLNWLTEQDYKLTKQVINQQYVVPTPDLFEPGVDKLIASAAEFDRKSIVPREIVFFGRLEERKGLRLFVAALSQISDFLKEKGISVVFMGKPSSVSGKSADIWISENSQSWKFDWRIESGFGQKEAIAFLQSADRLAVMASPIDNSPCTVYEAMQHGIPFLASTGGGIPELVHPEDRPSHLFDYNIASMAKQIRRAVNEGISAARPAISIAENQARWLTMHRDWKKYLPAPPKSKAKSVKWAVLIEHEKSAERLTECLTSIGKEISPKPEDIAVVRRENSDLPDLEGRVGAVIDDATDQTIRETIQAWQAGGYDGLICIRSAMSVVPNTGQMIASTMGKGIAAYAGQLSVGDEGRTFLSYVTSPAFMAYEGLSDSGIYLVDLKTRNLADAFAQLDDDRYFGGLIEQIHEIGGVVAPFPTVLAHTAKLENASLKVRGEQRRILALSRADRHSSYILAAVGHRMYAGVMGSALASVKQKVVEVATKSPMLERAMKMGMNMLRRARSGA